MKKTILAFAALSFSAMAFTTVANAQVSQSNVGTADPGYLEISVPLGPVTSINSTSERLNTISTKAVRNFAKNYKFAKEERWYEVSNGYLAKFNTNGVDNMVAYDLRGHWKFTISRYDEKGLPDDVRAIVKSTYYDYTITLIDEIHVDNRLVYMVHMQDANTWKNVSVCDGEMELVEDFNKR